MLVKGKKGTPKRNDTGINQDSDLAPRVTNKGSFTGKNNLSSNMFIVCLFCFVCHSNRRNSLLNSQMTLQRGSFYVPAKPSLKCRKPYSFLVKENSSLIIENLFQFWSGETGHRLEMYGPFCVHRLWKRTALFVSIDSGNVRPFLCPSKPGHGINKQNETGHGIWKTHYITNCTQAEMTTQSENYAIHSVFQEQWAKDSAKPTTSDRRSSKTKHSIENPRDSPSFSSKAVHGICKCSRFH